MRGPTPSTRTGGRKRTPSMERPEPVSDVGTMSTNRTAIGDRDLLIEEPPIDLDSIARVLAEGSVRADGIFGHVLLGVWEGRWKGR